MESLFSPARSLWARWLLLRLPFADVNEVLSKSEQEIKLDFSVNNWHSTKEDLKIMKMKLIKKWCWWYHSFVFCFQWWQNYCITCIHTACCPRTRPRSIRLKKRGYSRVSSNLDHNSDIFKSFTWNVTVTNMILILMTLKVLLLRSPGLLALLHPQLASWPSRHPRLTLNIEDWFQ